jgi:adenine-specific DNA-methyltransferase
MRKTKTIEKLDPKTDGASPDVVADNVERLRELFPEVFADGSIDFDALKETLGEYVDDREERYSFTWHGKRQARQIAQRPSTGALRPCPEESINWDATKNIFIEGDNLEILKLLQKSYFRKIRVIYIDPPYNTGKDFIYRDDFKDNLEKYLLVTGQKDSKGQRLSSNTETSGRYHTNWLNMLFPRIKLAWHLLKNDGLIFISIDDNEICNLRKMCDEIFGEENFVESFTVRSNPRGNQAKKHTASEHEYIVCYSKNKTELGPLGSGLSAEQMKEYSKEDETGKYRELGLRKRGAGSRRMDAPNQYYPIYVNPQTREISVEKPANGRSVEIFPMLSDGSEGRWRWASATVSKDKVRLVARLVKGRNGENRWDIFEKNYLSPDKKRKIRSILDSKKFNYENATEDLKELFGKKVFDYPKPVELIMHLLNNAGLRDGDIVLDFFAGSCVTPQAVLMMPLSIRFIAVQLPEVLARENLQQRDGYQFCIDNNLPPNIAEIGKERIRKTIETFQSFKEEIQEEMSAILTNGKKAGKSKDLGFKVFRLASSNIKPWDADFDTMEQDLLVVVDNIKPDRSENDVLYELLLKYGLDLAIPTETRTIEGRNVTVIGAGALIVCLADGITLDVVSGIAALKQELKPGVMRVVFLDSGFKDDVAKTNASQILKQAGIDDVKSL